MLSLEQTRDTLVCYNDKGEHTNPTNFSRHASTTLTINLYAHALPENDAQTAKLIGNLFSLPQGEQAEQEPLRKAV